MPDSVLIISYFFPPVGGAGVQRVTKFVKYLPQLGWDPIVLTALNPSVPVFDDSLLNDVPDSVSVHRAKTLEPNYAMKKAVSASSDVSGAGFNLRSSLKGFVRKVAIMLLQPDPQILWLPAAIREANKVIRTRKPALIFVSAPPFSTLLIAGWLARKHKLPLILDYRDEWDISNSVWENKKFNKISQIIQRSMQSYALRSATAITATTALSVNELSSKAISLGANPEARCIYNGFDAEDFSSDGPVKTDSKKFVLSYVGTLWNLTSIEPIVKALQRLAKEAPEIVQNLELRIAGRRTAEQEKLLAKLQDTPVEITLYDYMDHAAAIAMMRESNGLLLLLGDYEFAGRVVPGKIFEYFATANTIIAVAPEGEVWKLLDEYPIAATADPKNVEAIAQALCDCVSKFMKEGRQTAHTFDSSPFERRNLTRQLTELFSKVSQG